MRARGGGSLDRVKRQRVKSRLGRVGRLPGASSKSRQQRILPGQNGVQARDWPERGGTRRDGAESSTGTHTPIHRVHEPWRLVRVNLGAALAAAHARHGAARVSQITKQQTAKPALWLFSLGADAPEMIAILSSRRHCVRFGVRLGRLGLGATLRKIPRRKSRIESVVPAPVPPIRSKT